MEEEFVYCENCGSKMRANQRCCLKCGTLNFLNTENDSMEEVAEKAQKEKEKAQKFDDNKFISGEVETTGRVIYARHAGNRSLCLFINIFVYLLIIGLLLLLRVIPLNMEFITDYRYSLLLVGVTYIWFFILGIQLLYMKSDKRWWSVFIPIYGLYNWADLTLDRGWLFILMLIPGINIIPLIISFAGLGKKFSRSGLLCVVFPIIMLTNIAYSEECLYEGIDFSYSKKNDENAVMNTYSINNKLVKFVSFIIFISIAVFGYSGGREYIKYKYTEDIKVIVPAVKKAVEDNKLVCTKEYSESDKSEIYIYLDDAASELKVEIPSKYDVLKKVYRGYIKVENGNYYIGLSNGFYGVDNKLYGDEIEIEDIKLIKEVKYYSENVCVIKY